MDRLVAYVLARSAIYRDGLLQADLPDAGWASGPETAAAPSPERRAEIGEHVAEFLRTWKPG